MIVQIPDPFRMRYRKPIKEAVPAIVRERSTRKMAAARTREHASKLPVEDRPRFIETVEVELRSLHEGNIARYRLRPSEYQAWMEVWAG